MVVPAHRVEAVPAFAEQTGLSCQACHVGGFGPQLTPFGREFKLNGYTMRTKAFNVPLSAMAVGSFTHTRKDQVPAPDGLDRNDNLAFDEGSVFLAGGVGKHFGGFAQITYDGVEKAWAWDNLDLRAVARGKLFGADTVFGLTLNNSPTVQDAWNTTPAWGYPYTDTAVSGTPGAAPLIDDALAQNTLGLSAYAWVGQKIYAEAGAYTSPAAGTLDWLGADPGDPGDIHGLAPYGRLAWQHQVGGGTLQAGAFALKAAINPGRDRSSGLHDRYTDLGLDASWQKALSSGNTLSTQLRYVHESSTLRASCALALIGDGSSSECAHGHLNEWRGDIGYTWHNRIGTTLAAFAISGSRNADLYGGNGRPDSNGVMAQVDYTPWGGSDSPLGPRVNMRVGLQYTAYGKFDGSRHNYDNAGANASDNNALRLFTWLAF
ncbi:hypothetical protein LK12_19500 [Novosphingobium malaysiense]|uniref:Cytochrome C n=1 Tax=Novosphingobium malaysiense TaxID=1348853 RepID=A0A0B1ZK41_9SPHN|nr:hypothetical protein LK12_19500 [Novosphingobium malaysiense]